MDFDAIKNGDLHAYEQLFKAYYGMLCNYAMTFLKDRDLSEEVVQDLFVSVWEKKDNISITGSLKSYLFQATRNASLNQLKHLKVVREHEQYTMARDSGVVEGNQDRYEIKERFELAMEALPEQCRIVFESCKLEGKKYREVADELNISVKTVENQMGKALKIMREELSDFLPALVFLWSLS